MYRQQRSVAAVQVLLAFVSVQITPRVWHTYCTLLVCEGVHCCVIVGVMSSALMFTLTSFPEPRNVRNLTPVSGKSDVKSCQRVIIGVVAG